MLLDTKLTLLTPIDSCDLFAAAPTNLRQKSDI
jgi:hypothetical protein